LDNDLWGEGQENKETEEKYAAMFERRSKRGQCFHRPYLGCREFACDFRLIQDPDNELPKPILETRDLGFMLYDMDFHNNVKDPAPLFFRAFLDKGVINTDRRLVEVRG
jgi:CRISPR-associated protein Cas5d